MSTQTLTNEEIRAWRALARAAKRLREAQQKAVRKKRPTRGGSRRAD